MIDQNAIDAIKVALSAPTTFKNQVKILCEYPYHEVIEAIQKCANNRYIEIKDGDEYALWQNTSLPSIEMERVLKNESELVKEIKANHPEQNKSSNLSIHKSPIHYIRSNHYQPTQPTSINQPIPYIYNHPYHMCNVTHFENDEESAEIHSNSQYIGYIGKDSGNQSRSKLEKTAKIHHLITEVIVPWGIKKVLDYTTLTKDEKDIALVIIHLASNRNREKKPIHRSILYRIAGEKPYKHIVDALEKGTNEGKILEVYGYKTGVCSKGYRLTPKYHNRKKQLLKLSKPYNPWGGQDADIDSVHSDLVEILEWTLPYIILPSLEEVLQRAKELSDAGVKMLSSYKGEKIKKQCVYTVDQGKPIDFYDEAEFRILDLDIADFRKMLIDGWRTPIASNCGRVYYDLAGMPKWIRKLVRIKKNPNDVKGEEIVEVDYQALHSNLIPCIFKSRIPKDEYDKYIKEVAGDCHSKLAAHINATVTDPTKHYSRQDMKVIGLSFWNKTHKQQMKSPIYPYLSTEYPKLMKAIACTKFSNPSRIKTKVVKDKITGEKKTKVISMAHAETSEILFKSESALMEENMSCLKEEGIVPIYCYDALWVRKSHEEYVRYVMNRTAEIWEIPTRT